MTPESAVDHEMPDLRPKFELVPHWDLLLIRPVEFDDETTVQLVSTDVDAPDRGEILALGPQVDTELFHVGDVVLWGKYSGIPSPGDRHLVRQRDILCTVRGAKIREKSQFDAVGRVQKKK